MFQDLRLELGLTRPELADATHRSVNYILKAESLTFPTPPPALLEFYAHRGYDKEILRTAYRDAQTARRRTWLDYWVPAHPQALSGFRRKWMSRLDEAHTVHPIHPTEYRVSQGLCIPAAAVYRVEKTGWVNQSIKDALSDLVDYCVSGEYYAAYGYDDVVSGVLRIAKEIGVNVRHYGISA